MIPQEFFKGKEHNIYSLLTDGNYNFCVPDYQRKYAWTQNELTDFWNDFNKTVETCYSNDYQTFNEHSEPHFLGAIVLTDTSANTYEVTDGQQRLTTISIFTSTLLELIQKIDNIQIQSGLTSRISPILYKHQFGDPFEQRLVLDDTINDFFKYYILKINNKSDRDNYISLNPPPNNSSKQYIVDAYEFFHSKLSLEFTDEITKELYTNKLSAFINVLTRYLLVLQLTVFKKETAYTIFETLNKRGKDLSESDMIKNELFKCFATSERNDIKDMWDKISENLETENLTEYIRFHFASHIKNVTPAKLYEVIKVHIHSIDARNYLYNLETESKWFSRITLIDNSHWDDETIELLKTFQILDVSHCYPLLLSGAVVYSNDIKSFKMLLKNTVTFCFRYFTIGRNSVSDLENEIGFLSRFIRNLGSTIKHNKKDYTFNNLNDIANYMKDLSDDSLFESKFTQFSTKTNTIAFYILYNLEKKLKTGVIPLPHGPGQHVEHIMPKTPSRSAKRSKEWAHVKDDPNYKEHIFKLGNLLILESNINQKIKNKDYSIKKSEYTNSGLYYPLQVATNFSTWNFRDIENRQYQMSKVALEVWTYSLSPNLTN